MSKYLIPGSTYIENDADAQPTGSLWKYLGVVERTYGDDEHEFQCLEFDCEDEFTHYSINTDDATFQRWFTLNEPKASKVEIGY